MSINISKNSPFYKGTEKLSPYGNGSGAVSAKDEMVKYEFNTKDEFGNKIMDKMTKEETMKALKEIGKLYGDNVIVSISGDGLAALVDDKAKQDYRASCETEEKKAEQARKNELFQATIKDIQRRQIIPNIQTNAALVKSLKGLEDNVVDTVYGIIENNLLKRNVGDMTEKERQDLISLGMEQSKYIAENYLSKDKKDEFLAAMETIAKYGMNGTTDKDGKVTFDIKKGPMVGMPDDYDADMDELLKEKSPETYKEMMDLLTERGKTDDGGRLIEIGKRIIELKDRARSILYTSGAAQQKKADYIGWKEQIEKTELVNNFQDSQYQNEKSFVESIFRQNEKVTMFQSDFLHNNMQKFLSGLGIEMSS